jgi:hypothetical protein
MVIGLIIAGFQDSNLGILFDFWRGSFVNIDETEGYQIFKVISNNYLMHQI